MKPSPSLFFSRPLIALSRWRWLRSVISTLTVTLGGSALVLAAEEAASAKVPVEERKGSVWSVSDGDNTVYLAGSVHLLREEDYPISPVYDQAYADSESIVMEVDMAEMMSPQGMMQMQQLGMFGPDDQLSNHLSEELIKRIEAYLEKDQMGKMMVLALPRMKPGMVLLSISSVEAMRMNARPDLGLEMVYYQKAAKDGKEVTGLETLEYQMTRFEGISDEEMEKMLSSTMDEAENMADTLGKLIASWHRGEETEIDEIINEEFEDDSKFRQLLLTERNANWVPEVEKAIKGSENVMFLVGAAHLVGKGSVVDLLRKKGYEVKKVDPKPAAAEQKKAA